MSTETRLQYEYKAPCVLVRHRAAIGVQSCAQNKCTYARACCAHVHAPRRGSHHDATEEIFGELPGDGDARQTRLARVATLVRAQLVAESFDAVALRQEAIELLDEIWMAG